MVEPAVVGLFQERGIDVTQTMSRLKSKRPGAAMEIDIVAVNGSELVAVECKSRLSRDDVDDLSADYSDLRLLSPNFESFGFMGQWQALKLIRG